MQFKREIVTPYLGVIFTVVAISGILMFFHLFDDYTNVVHEFLGLGFALFAILHIFTNWKSIENYGKKRKMFFPSVIILFVSVSLIVIGKVKGNLENELLIKMTKAPVYSSFKTLGIDYNQAKIELQSNHIVLTDSLQSIEEIAEKNGKSSEEIIELVYE